MINSIVLQATESKALEIPQESVPVIPEIIPGTVSRYSSQRVMVDATTTTPIWHRIFLLLGPASEPDKILSLAHFRQTYLPLELKRSGASLGKLDTRLKKAL